MTNLQIKIIDTDHNNEIVEIDLLTPVGVEMLVSDTERLLEKLKDKLFNGDDE